MIELSSDQQDAVVRVATWFKQVGRLKSGWCRENHAAGGDGESDDEEGLPHTHGHTFPAPVMSLGGLAGTGKTTLVKMLDEVLGAVLVFGTPTHKAASVLRAKLDERQRENVRTYHSIIYQSRVRYHCLVSGATVQPVSHGCDAEEMVDCDHAMTFGECGEGVTGHAESVGEELRFELRDTIGGYRDLVVIDEASMLSEQQVNDVRALGVPVLLIGDHGQLPPVKAAMNPWMLAPDVLLEVNHRQGEGSGIIGAAMTARQGSLALGRYGDGAMVVARSDGRVDAMLERWESGPQSALIVPTNKLRSVMNQRYHRLAGGGSNGLPGSDGVRAGDRVVALQQCRLVPVLSNGVATGELVSVHNGATGVVTRVMRARARTVDLVVRLDDAVRGDELLVSAAVDQFGLDRVLARNEYPRSARLWDYAYAITAHKAQGSEWTKVLVMGEPWSDYARWMYTAVTRAKDKLVVVRNG